MVESLGQRQFRGGWRSEHPNSHLHSAEAFPLQGVLGCEGGVSVDFPGAARSKAGPAARDVP